MFLKNEILTFQPLLFYILQVHSKSRLSNIMHCPNCDNEILKNYSFCPNCGQETKLDQSIKSLLSHFLNDYFTFDSKIIRSVVPLITKPAFLTKEYLAGKRVKFIAPLRLFIFLSIIFFLLLGWLNPSNATETDISGLNDEFWNVFFDKWLPKMFFFLLPLFAIVVAWLYRKNKHGIMPHLLFSIHFHATLFLTGILYGIISFFILKMGWVVINQIFLALVGLYLIIFLWKSLRKMYGESRKKTAWKIVVLGFTYLFLLIGSSFVLFALSLNY